MNDNALIKRTLDGDTTAFDELVLKYQDRLYRTLVRRSRNHEDAADAVQDTFLQAFLKLDTFEHRSGFYTWLFRIGCTTASRYRNRRQSISLEAAYVAG